MAKKAVRRQRLVLDVHDGVEALLIRTALDDPQTRAFVLVVGDLLRRVGPSRFALSIEARRNALSHVEQVLDNTTGE